MNLVASRKTETEKRCLCLFITERPMQLTHFFCNMFSLRGILYIQSSFHRILYNQFSFVAFFTFGSAFMRFPMVMYFCLLMKDYYSLLKHLVQLLWHHLQYFSTDLFIWYVTLPILCFCSLAKLLWSVKTWLNIKHIDAFMWNFEGHLTLSRYANSVFASLSGRFVCEIFVPRFTIVLKDYWWLWKERVQYLLSIYFQLLMFDFSCRRMSQQLMMKW